MRWSRLRRTEYGDALAPGVRPAALGLAAVFTMFALWHPFALAPADATVMTPVAAATAAGALLTRHLLHRHPVGPVGAHLVAVGLVAAAFANCVVHYRLTHAEHQSVNVMLLVVGVGVCFVDPVWTAGVVSALVLAWLAVLDSGSASQVIAAAPDLAAAVAVATIANVVRRRNLERLLDAQAELRRLSQRDELTGLLNRRGFLSVAEDLIASPGGVTVWFLDVDGLKRVNDECGHDAGDAVLRAVAGVVTEVYADGQVARLSGDEFAVVGPATTEEARRERQHRLDQSLRSAAERTGLALSVSTGSASWTAGQSLSSLLAAADAAMYETKAARRRASAEAARIPPQGSFPARGRVPAGAGRRRGSPSSPTG